MQASSKLPRLGAALCLAVALAACQPPAGLRTGPSAAALESRAAQLASHGDHAGAARAWQQAAATASAARSNGLWLAAAREWLAAGDAAAAAAALTRLAAPVAPADAREKTRLEAELAIAAGQPKRGLAILESPGMAPDAAVLATRARAQFALGQVTTAVRSLIQRDALLTSERDHLANDRLILDGVAAAAARGADVRPAAGTDALMAGWLELGRIQADAAISSAGIAAELRAWQSRYPAHPANGRLVRSMLEHYAIGVAPSSQVALLLPLSGRASSAGLAVMDGFMTAYYEQPQGTRPVIRVYDVAASDAQSAYLAALADGARVVVGPLTRDEVGRLAAIADGRATTLALNFLPDGVVTPSRFYQFALSPEDEAREAARRAVADGRGQGVALAPATDWGNRVMAAFSAELAANGGRLLDSEAYAPGTTDFNAILTRLLQIQPSQTDDGKPTKVYRADAQFIFVAAQPVTARLIRTQLRFNYASRLPAYATSDAYEPGGRGNGDLDGMVFPDMPWVTDTTGPAAALRAAMAAAWPDRPEPRSRLYAFGYDAYTIVAELGRHASAPFATPLAGLTGRLTMDPQGRIHRDMPFVQVVDGNEQLLPPGPPTAR